MAEKPELGLLIGVGKPKGDPMAAEPEAPEEDAKLLAVKAFRSALKSGDDQGVLDALLNLIDNLESEEEAPVEEPAPAPF